MRSEAGHAMFSILCYLKEITPVSPTGERGNSQVRSLVMENSKCTLKRLL